MKTHKVKEVNAIKHTYFPYNIGTRTPTQQQPNKRLTNSHYTYITHIKEKFNIQKPSNSEHNSDITNLQDIPLEAEQQQITESSLSSESTGHCFKF
jgi:hypothetical protein